MKSAEVYSVNLICWTWQDQVPGKVLKSKCRFDMTCRRCKVWSARCGAMQSSLPLLLALPKRKGSVQMPPPSDASTRLQSARPPHVVIIMSTEGLEMSSVCNSWGPQIHQSRLRQLSCFWLLKGPMCESRQLSYSDYLQVDDG